MIESRDSFIGIFTRRQSNHDFNRGGREIVDRANLDLLFSSGVFNRADDGFGRSTKRELPNYEVVVVSFFNLGPDFYFAIAFIVLAGVHQPALRKVRQQLEFPVLENGDLRLE